MKQLFFLSWAAIFLLYSCGETPCYDEFHPLPDSGWTYADSIPFSFEVKDTSKAYDLLLRLDHSPDFPYSNFYVQIHTRYPDGKSLKQVLSLELAAKSGLWFGRCNRKRCSLSLPLQEQVHFNQTGTYHITLEQYSRKDTLPGIFGAGLELWEREEQDSRN